MSNDQATEVVEFLKLKDLKNLKSECKNELQKEGVKELEEILEILNEDKYLDQVQVDPSR